MEHRELFEKLRAVECSESVFSRVMNAKTVQELLDIPVSPGELMSYFTAIEELGGIQEERILYRDLVYHRLKGACPAKTRRHALFM